MMMTSTLSLADAEPAGGPTAGPGAPPVPAGAEVAVSVTTACTSRAPAARNSFWLISKAKSGYWLMAGGLLLSWRRRGGRLNRVGDELGGDVVVAPVVQSGAHDVLGQMIQV